MEIFKQHLNLLMKTQLRTKKIDLKNHLETILSENHFLENDTILSSLFQSDKPIFDDYIKIKDEYSERNLYSWIFEIIDQKYFEKNIAQGYLKGFVPELKKPSKKTDPVYAGQYDFCLEYKENLIKIEVKASRAVDAEIDAPLQVKALHSTSERPFDMNFQQIKPKCCDVFIWMGVWRDEIKYWVLSSKEVAENPFFSDKQHRGNIGVGQLHIKNTNIANFKKYETKPNQLFEAIISAYKRNSK